jgi:GxxExxY protein
MESELTETVIGSAFEIANVLGEYLADHVVEEKVIVELKRVERFANEHLAQCINYLKASGLRVALP